MTSGIVKSAVLVALLAGVGTAAAEESEDEKKWDVSAPTEETRPVAFDVDEGTWLSLDVSPDGSEIIFDLLGDIYKLPISGGEAVSLSSGIAWDMQPRYSPDGSQIAFTSDRDGGDNIFVMNADGSDIKAITKESFRLLNNPVWTPDGQFIAARKHFTTRRSLGTGEIWLYHVSGEGSGVQLVARPSPAHQKELGEPIISADGRYLYYSMDATPGSSFQYAQDSNGQIFVINRMDMANGDVSRFVSGAGGAVRPTPSPDGRYLAFVRRIRAKSALYLKDLISGEERPLYKGLDQDMQETWAVHGAYPNMDWTPDSRSIVFWAGGKIKRINIETGDVGDIPFHVSDTRDVIDPPRHTVEVAPDSFPTKMVKFANISPDGSSAVFESLGRIYVKNLESGDIRALTSDAQDHFEFYPVWSPDGRWIAFVSWDDQLLGAIRRVRARGGNSEVLTGEPGHYVELNYSPDGSKIYYRKAGGGFLTAPEWSLDQGIYAIPAEGGEAVRLTESGRDPHPAAGRLYFTRDSDGKHFLMSTDLAGEDERQHAVSDYARRFFASPDGNWLAFRENYQIYLTPLPKGGKPLTVSPKKGSMPLAKASGNGGNYPRWAADSASLSWSLGPTLFEASVEDIMATDYAAPESGHNLSQTVTAEKPSGLIALVGARVVARAEAGHVIENGVVLIDGNRIAAVGPAASIAIPEDAVVVDLTGKTILPGIIDAHAHGGQGVNDIIPEQNWSAHATLALGVTTVHDPSNTASHVFAAAEMQRAGRILAPRIYSTGEIVYGAHSELNAHINSLEDALEHIRRLKAQGAISVKNYNQPRRDQRQQVAAAARAEGMMVVTEGGSLYHTDMSMVVDGNTGIEHNLPQSALYEDVLQLWSGTKVSYTPTFVVTYGGPPAERYFY